MFTNKDNAMEHIDAKKASEARDYIYSGKVFSDGIRDEVREEPVEEVEKEELKVETDERMKRLEEARNALFSGKLFK